MLSAKEGKKAWVEVVLDPAAPDGWRFVVKTGALSKEDEERLKKGTKTARGSNFSCILTGAAINGDHVKAEGMAGRMNARLMAIVAEGARNRTYLTPTKQHEAVAVSAKPTWKPEGELAPDLRAIWCPLYGLKTFASLHSSSARRADDFFRSGQQSAGQGACGRSGGGAGR